MERNKIYRLLKLETRKYAGTVACLTGGALIDYEHNSLGLRCRPTPQQIVIHAGLRYQGVVFTNFPAQTLNGQVEVKQ